MQNLFFIKMKRVGRYKKPYYQIIVVNKNKKFLSKLGTYNPFTFNNRKILYLNKFLLLFWLSKGACLTLFLNKIVCFYLSEFFDEKY